MSPSGRHLVFYHYYLSLLLTISTLSLCFFTTCISSLLTILPGVLYLDIISCFRLMLRHQTCRKCGRQVRMSAAIQPALCPACRLSPTPLAIETRPCVGCQIPLRAESSDTLCPRCLSSTLSDGNALVRPCHDCTNPFSARPGVIRCSPCRTRRANNTITRSSFDLASFNPFQNSLQLSSSFNPFQNSLQLSSPRKRSAPLTPRSSTSTLARRKPAHDEIHIPLIRQGLGFLQREFDLRMQASHIFPPEISPSHIRSSIARYENSMAAVSQETSCCSCGRLVPLDDVRQIPNNDPF